MQKLFILYTGNKNTSGGLQGMLCEFFVYLDNKPDTFFFRELANIFSEEPSEQRLFRLAGILNFSSYTATFILWRFLNGLSLP